MGIVQSSRGNFEKSEDCLFTMINEQSLAGFFIKNGDMGSFTLTALSLS
jgi:hypothetical protein